MDELIDATFSFAVTVRLRGHFISRTTALTSSAPHLPTPRLRQDRHLAQDDVPSPIPALPRPAAVPDRTADTDDHDRGIDVDQA